MFIMAITVHEEGYAAFDDEEIAWTEKGVSTEEGFFVSNEAKISVENKNVVPFLTPIPFVHFMLLFLLVAVLSLSLNIIVVLYYRKSKDITRFYILALVIMDWCIIALILMPLSILLYCNLSENLSQGLFFSVLVGVNTVFSLYLYTSLFLALDRFLVVLFPLKFRDYVGKLRIFKAVWAGMHVIYSTLDSINQIVFGINSASFSIFKLISVSLTFFILTTISILYTIMAMQIIRSSKKLAKSRQDRTNDR